VDQVGSLDDAASSIGDLNMATEEIQEKIDIDKIRSHIDETLKEKSKQYWDIFRNFLRCKLTKQELDDGVRSLFGGDSMCSS